MDFLTQIKTFFVSIPVIFGSFFGLVDDFRIISLEDKITVLEQQISKQSPDKLSFGAYNITGGGTYRLKSSVGISDATLQVSTFKEPVSNIPYTMSYLNTTVAYGTIDPQTTRSEFVSFTGITQNTDGSAQLTGVTRGLSRSPAGSGCVASSTLAQRHPGQSIFILSDSPCHFAEYAVKQNDETITGDWKGPTPATPTSFVNRNYVDGKTFGGIGNASETATGTVEIATGAEIAASTLNGTLGRLAIPATLATSTWNISTAGNVIPVSDLTTKKIDSNFISTSTLQVLTHIGGDGSDGNVAYTSGLTALTRDMYYENLSVSGTAVLNPNGYRIYVRDTLVCNATGGAYIGQPGGNATNAIGLNAGAAGISAYTANTGPLPSAQNGLNGMNGFSVTNGQGSTGAATQGSSTIYSIGSGGGYGGGPGNLGSITTGGQAGSSTVTIFPRNYTYANNFFFLWATSSLSVATGTPIFYRGSAGSSNSTGALARAAAGITTNSGGGGGSGASGGSLWVEATHLNLTGTCLTVAGGNGGNGSNANQTGGSFSSSYGEGGGGGGGGAGGVLVLIYGNKSGSGTWSYSGGTGGTGGTSSGGIDDATAGGNGGSIGGYIIKLGN